jgi:hypothetical protein
MSRDLAEQNNVIVDNADVAARLEAACETIRQSGRGR